MKKLKPHAVDWAQIDRFLASADKKLASARKILAFDEEAVFNKPTKQCSKLRWGSCSATDSVQEARLATTSPSSTLCGHVSTRNMPVCWSFLIVSAESAIRPFMMTPDLFLTMMPSKRSNPP